MCLRLCAFASSCQGVGTSLSTAHVAPWQPTGMCTVADAVSKDFLKSQFNAIFISNSNNLKLIARYLSLQLIVYSLVAIYTATLYLYSIFLTKLRLYNILSMHSLSSWFYQFLVGSDMFWYSWRNIIVTN